MSEHLRILIGVDVLPESNSGVAGTVMATSEALASLGHTVEAFWADSLGRKISHGNLHYFLELPRAYRREVQRRLRAHPADVVQLSQPYAYLAGRHVRKHHPDTLMVWRSHGLEAKVDEALRQHVATVGPWWKAPLHRLSEARRLAIQRAAIRWCDGMIVPCTDDRDFLVNRLGASPDRVRVIWHGVPDEYIDTPVANDPGRWQRVLHVSQMSANKGTAIMLQVIASFLKQCPRATITLVCPGSVHDAVRSTLGAQHGARVRMVDWVTREALRKLYDSHGMFVFPTLAEGAAKVVMEAMSRGMCVVASDTSGPRDYIQHERNGYLAPVGDIASLTRCTVDALRDAERSSCMGKEAKRTAAAFRWSRCAAELTSFYRDLKLIKGGAPR